MSYLQEKAISEKKDAYCGYFASSERQMSAG